MISRSLVDLLNSGQAVAITGAGISADAGLPAWDRLFQDLADALDILKHDTHKARDMAAKRALPEAFELLAAMTSREDIHQRVASRIEAGTTPGRHHKRLADWPFRFHVTTNYDQLVERASTGQLVAIGNRGVELHKLSAGVRDIVWHIHGASGMQAGLSQLVVTKSDYDDFYPASNCVEKLKAVATAFRCVFIGFGFKDADFVQVLHAVGRLSHGGLPSFAFLSYDGSSDESVRHQEELRKVYNIEVIPYYTQGRDHGGLHRLLDAYASFVVRRSMNPGRLPSATPSYDASATSLRVQSGLDFAELSSANAGMRHTLVGVRVLAHIREHPGGTESELAAMSKADNPPRTAVLECLQGLRERGIVTPSPGVDFAAAYHSNHKDAEARLDLARARFLGSLFRRAEATQCVLVLAAQERAVALVCEFLEDLCRQRGLGVAQNLATSNSDQASVRAVALLQQLPDFLGKCQTRDEALAAVQLTTDLLTRPTEAESGYLGLLCQCYFGLHLAGASDKLADIDIDLIKGTAYVLDASVLVCLLAEGCEFCDFASSLVRDLKACGATLATTSMLADEIAEHADWAMRHVAKYGELSQQVIDALQCARGYRPNQFLRGYFLGETGDSSFASYLARILRTTARERITRDTIADRLAALGIPTLQFADWEGFEQTQYAKRDEVQGEIDRRRFGNASRTHSRQTQAEAEVALIVDGIRRKVLQPPGSAVTDAFFLSSTRVVDAIPNLVSRVSLQPDGLAQWLWSSQAGSSRNAELVFQELLWELAESGVEFVNKSSVLRKFSGVVEAAAADLNSAIKDRREYLVDKYGADPAAAFANADPMDIPRYATEVQREALDRMTKALADAAHRETTIRAAAAVSEKDRQELAKLRAKQAERHKKAMKNKRSSASRNGKNK